MVGRLHSRQGLQSGRGAAGKSPFLLLDISEFFSFFFFSLRGGRGVWMCKPLVHITVIITSLWCSSVDSRKGGESSEIPVRRFVFLLFSRRQVVLLLCRIVLLNGYNKKGPHHHHYYHHLHCHFSCSDKGDCSDKLAKQPLREREEAHFRPHAIRCSSKTLVEIKGGKVIRRRKH